MKFWILFLIPLSCTPWLALAESNESSQVVDLGQMSVSGDVRKPSISWIDSQKAVRDQVPGFLKYDFEEFERTLIEHAEDQKSEEPSTVQESRSKK
jgi:hypothetical protein